MQNYHLHKLVFLAFMFSLLNVAAATGADWYVATVGADTASCGSDIEPCASVQYVIDNRAADNDVVRVQPGTYGSGFSLTGTSPDGLTITAVDTSNRPLINGGISIGDGATGTTVSYLRVDGGTRGDYYSGVVDVSEYPTLIDNMEIFDGGQGVMIRTSQQVTVSNSEIYNLGLTGTDYDTMCVLIVNWQNDPIPAGFDHAILLKDNILHDCGGDGMQENSWSEAGVQFNYLIMDGNEIYNNQEQGIDTKGTDDFIIRNNNIYGNGYGGIANNQVYGSTERWQIYNNQIHDHSNYAIFNQGGGAGWKVYNNEIYQNVSSPTYSYCAVAIPGDADSTFYNNVVYSNTDTGGAARQTCGIIPRAMGDRIINNIFWNNGTGSDDHGNIRNNWSEDSGTPSFNYVYPETCGTGQCQTGTNAVTVADPLLVNPATYDFSLQASSPLIDAGTALDGLYTLDILGNMRPQGAGWDIGAYEFIRFPWPMFIPAITENGLQ